MARLKLLACKVLYREISYITAGCSNIIDVTYLRQGLHDTPDKLRTALRYEIEQIDAGDDIHSYQALHRSEQSTDQDFDAILLGYGLCSNAIIGLKSKKYKIVVPRAHDCITLFLGSKERYKEYFNERKGGIYWYTRGWIENTDMPGRQREKQLRDKYIELYGEENADYLLETAQSWLKEYSSFTYIDWPEISDKGCADYTKDCADYLHRNYEMMNGDSSLLHDFLTENWDNERFLVVPPGCEIISSFDDSILGYRQ